MADIMALAPYRFRGQRAPLGHGRKAGRTSQTALAARSRIT